MEFVTVVAIQAFTHQGRSYHKGEAVTIAALDAAVLAQARKVTLDRAARATYRTADLSAAQPPLPAAIPVIELPPAVAETAAPAVATASTPRRRRTRSKAANV